MNKNALNIGLIVLAIISMVFIILLRLSGEALTGSEQVLSRIAALLMAGIFVYFAYSELNLAKTKTLSTSSRMVSGIRVPMYIFAGAFMLYFSYAGI